MTKENSDGTQSTPEIHFDGCDFSGNAGGGIKNESDIPMILRDTRADRNGGDGIFTRGSVDARNSGASDNQGAGLRIVPLELKQEIYERLGLPPDFPDEVVAEGLRLAPWKADSDEGAFHGIKGLAGAVAQFGLNATTLLSNLATIAGTPIAVAFLGYFSK